MKSNIQLLSSHSAILAATLLSLALISGCTATGSARSESAAPAAAVVAKGPGPGMNANGEVVDSSKVEAGYGQ